MPGRPTLYVRAGCHLCEDASVLLDEMIGADAYDAVDIETDDDLLVRYAHRIPVLAIHSRDDGLIEVEPVEEFVAQQKASGAPVELRVVEGLAHHQTARFAAPLSEAVSWLNGVWR